LLPSRLRPYAAYEPPWRDQTGSPRGRTARQSKIFRCNRPIMDDPPCRVFSAKQPGEPPRGSLNQNPAACDVPMKLGSSVTFAAGGFVASKRKVYTKALTVRLKLKASQNLLLSADRANADWLHRECMLPIAAARLGAQSWPIIAPFAKAACQPGRRAHIRLYDQSLENYLVHSTHGRRRTSA